MLGELSMTYSDHKKQLEKILLSKKGQNETSWFKMVSTFVNADSEIFRHESAGIHLPF